MSSHWRVGALSALIAFSACTDESGEDLEQDGSAETDGAVSEAGVDDAAADDDGAAEGEGSDASADSGVFADAANGGDDDAAASDAGHDAAQAADAASDAGTADSSDSGEPVDAARMDASAPSDGGGLSDGGLDAAGDGATPSEASTPGDPDSSIAWWTVLPCGRLGSVRGTANSVIDVGHAAAIDFLAKSDERLLSVDRSPSWDRNSNWVLWNTANRTIVARGETELKAHYMAIPPSPFVAANRFVAGYVQGRSGQQPTYHIELRSLESGQLLTAVTMNAQMTSVNAWVYGIATDGSYFWVASAMGIRAWNASGAIIIDKTREAEGSILPEGGVFDQHDYYTAASQRRVFAVPGELIIAGAPGGPGQPIPSDTLQRISTATGNATTSQFLGEFHDWFDDGSAFMTTVGATVRIYRTNPLQQRAIFSVTNDLRGRWGGRGDHFWMRWMGIEVRSLSNPSATLFQRSSSVLGVDIVGETLAMVPDTQPPILEQVRFAEAGQPITTTQLPRYPRREAVLVQGASGAWALGDTTGGIFDSADASTPLSCGAPSSVTGSDTGRAVIVTGAGGANMFEFTPTSRRFVSRVPFPPTAVHAELSADGDTLLVGTTPPYFKPSDTFTVGAYALPAFSEIQTWTPDMGTTTERGFSLSANGQRFAIRSAGRYQVFARGNGTASFTLPNSTPVLHFSPSGARLAVLITSNPIAADIYQDGVLVGAAISRPLGWLDESRLVAAYSGLRILDPQGNVLADIGGFVATNYMHRVTSDSFYIADGASGIYSSAGGPALWTGPQVSMGTTAGQYAVGVGPVPYEIGILAY